MRIKIADSITVRYCTNCAAFHVLLFKDDKVEPFAACSITSDEMSELLDEAAEEANDGSEMVH